MLKASKLGRMSRTSSFLKGQSLHSREPMYHKLYKPDHPVLLLKGQFRKKLLSSQQTSLMFFLQSQQNFLCTALALEWWHLLVGTTFQNTWGRQLHSRFPGALTTWSYSGELSRKGRDSLCQSVGFCCRTTIDLVGSVPKHCCALQHNLSHSAILRTLTSV